MSSALMIASIASTVIGAGVSAAGAAQQGRNASNLANYNAQIAQNDAIAARQKAEFDATALERQQKLLSGSQRASIAATGGSLLDSGDVFDMTAEEQEIDYLATLYGGETAARAAEQRGTLSKYQGSIAKSEGKSKALGTLITGATSAATMGSKLPKGPKTPQSYTSPPRFYGSEGI
tara:strand:- start:3328 stop:3858 length:531 start_codon:yes stop_codon:yes gene_type:complete